MRDFRRSTTIYTSNRRILSRDRAVESRVVPYKQYTRRPPERNHKLLGLDTMGCQPSSGNSRKHLYNMYRHNLCIAPSMHRELDYINPKYLSSNLSRIAP